MACTARCYCSRWRPREEYDTLQFILARRAIVLPRIAAGKPTSAGDFFQFDAGAFLLNSSRKKQTPARP